MIQLYKGIQRSIRLTHSISLTYYRKKLSKLLSRTPLFDLINAIWHIDRVQSGDIEKAHYFNGIPEEAKTSDLTSRYYIFKWDLEALLTQHFLTAPSRMKAGRIFRTLNLGNWSAFVTLINELKRVENAESAVSINSETIFLELHRIAQRQFPWQRGFVGKRLLHRYMYIYRNPRTRERFLQTYGLDLDEFSKIGFVLWAQFNKFSHTSVTTSFDVVNLGDQVRDAFLSRVSDTPDTAKAFYEQYRRNDFRIPHWPSRLRTHPLIILNWENKKYIVAPLPDLIFLRVTEGLFYDFVQFDDLRESIAAKYVEYCCEWTERTRNNFELLGEIEYQKGGNRIRSPDIFLKSEGRIAVAIECKSRRMAHAAQFGVNPLDEARSGFVEIANGIVQLWRYIADSEQGLVPDPYNADENTLLLLLTLDSWMDAPMGLKARIIALANDIADEKHISKDSRANVSFASIGDYEYVLERGDTTQIIGAIRKQGTEKYTDWMLSNVFDELYGQIKPTNPFSENDLEKHVSWWSDFDRDVGSVV